MKKLFVLIISISCVFICILAIIAFAFDQKLISLLVAGGVVLTMIIGLAIQVDIADIFSAIALNMDRPFLIGDWVKIGEFEEGKVIDLTWRAIRLRTRDDAMLCIPNRQASQFPIKNFSHNENKGYWKYFTIHVDPHHPPERVKKVLLGAAMSAKGVLLDDPDHPPGTRFLGLTRGMTGQSESWAANYLIGVYVADYGKKFAHNEEIWEKIWTHLKAAGIRHVVERQEVHLMFPGTRKDNAKAPVSADPIDILRDVEVFRPFSDEDKAYLSKRMKHHHFGPLHEVVTQGDPGDSLFIIAEGSASVEVNFGEGNTMEVARLGARDFFGDMALLTGEERKATIRPLVNTHLYEITKADVYPLFEKQPELLEALSKILAKQRMAFDPRPKSNIREEENALGAQFLEKMRGFFGFVTPTSPP